MRFRMAGAAVVAGALIASVAACGGSGTSASGSSTGKGVVTFMSWDSLATMKPLITEFEKDNPGITIQASYVPPVQQYDDTLTQRLLAHQAADVFILGNKTQQVGGGYVMDLSSLPAVKELSSFNKAAETYNGKVYGVSVASWGGGMLVNLGLLKKVGVTKPPATWADFLALVAKLKAAGINPYLEPSDGISTTIMGKVGEADAQSGGNMDTKIESGQTTFSTAWTAALQSWSQLFSSGLVSKDVAALTGTEVSNEFAAGRVAMIATGSWEVATVRQGAPSMGLAFWPVPGASAGDDYWAGAANPAYAINSRAKNVVGAQKWINFLASATGSKIYHQRSGAPGRRGRAPEARSWTPPSSPTSRSSNSARARRRASPRRSTSSGQPSSRPPSPGPPPGGPGPARPATRPSRAGVKQRSIRMTADTFVAETRSAPPTRRSPSPKSFQRRWRERVAGEAFLIPIALVVVILIGIPLVRAVYYSFTDYSGMSPDTKFVGLRNYESVFTNSSLLTGLTFTLLFAVSTTLVITVLAIPLAVMLNRRFFGRGFLRAISFFPAIPSIAVLGLVWNFILSPLGSGALNQALHALFGTGAVPWLADTATLDGANARQRFFGITLPLLTPAVSISTTLLMIGGLNVYALPATLTGGGPGYSTYTIMQMIIIDGISNAEYGLASALGVVFMIAVGIVLFGQLLLTRRIERWTS